MKCRACLEIPPQSNALIRCQKKSRPTKTTTYPGMAHHQASHGNIIAGTMHTQQVKHEATAAARELKSTSMVRSFCQRDVPQSWLRKVSMRLPLSEYAQGKERFILSMSMSNVKAPNAFRSHCGAQKAQLSVSFRPDLGPTHF